VPSKQSAKNKNPSKGFLEKISELKGVKKVEDLRQGDLIKFKAILNNNDSNATIKEIRNILTVSLSFQTKITVRSSNGEDTRFKQCTIPDIVNKWAKWRVAFELKVLDRLLKLEREKLDKNELMILIIANLDIVKKALEADHFQKYLIKHLDITEEQAKYVEGKTLSSLTKVSKDALIDKVKESKKKIKSFKYFIENPVERIISEFE
jgi:DNA gyrase/topoisomerase IV subunit A